MAMLVVLTAGCVAYLDKPPVRTISGRIVDESSDEPIRNINVYFYSGRKYTGLADTFGIDVSAVTDTDGRFAVTSRLNAVVTAVVYANSKYYRFDVPAFSVDGTSKDILWKIK